MKFSSNEILKKFGKKKEKNLDGNLYGRLEKINRREPARELGPVTNMLEINRVVSGERINSH